MVKTVQDVKVVLDKMNMPPPDPADLAEALPDGFIPTQFFCPITQDVMQDPVKTCARRLATPHRAPLLVLSAARHT